MMAGSEGEGEPAKRLDLQRLADEIGEITADDRPLPSVVTQGPRAD